MPEGKPSNSTSSESIDSSQEFIELHRHSFIVNIWLEETIAEAGQVTWRGHITHVATGQRRYVASLNNINDFFASYLKKMGIQPSFLQRLLYRLGLAQNK